MKDEITLKIEVERGFNTPRGKINDLIRKFVFDLKAIGVNVLNHSLIKLEFRSPKGNE